MQRKIWDSAEQKKNYLSIFEGYASKHRKWVQVANQSSDKKTQKVLEKLGLDIHVEIARLKGPYSFTPSDAKESDQLIGSCKLFSTFSAQLERDQFRQESLASFGYYEGRIQRWKEIAASPDASNEAKESRRLINKLQEQITKVMYILNHPPVTTQHRYDFKTLLEQCERLNNRFSTIEKNTCRSFFLSYKKTLNQWKNIAIDYQDYSNHKEPYDLVQRLQGEVNNALKTLDGSAPLSDDTLSDFEKLAQTYQDNKEIFSKYAKEAMGKVKAKRPVIPWGPLTYGTIQYDNQVSTSLVTTLFTRSSVKEIKEKEKASLVHSKGC